MKKKSSGPVLSLSTALFKGSLIHNPILTQIIGICPILGAATTLANGLCLSVCVFAVLTVCEALTSLVLRRVPRWIRLALYTLVSLIIVLLCDKYILALTSDSGAGLGIYFYLISVNALTVIRCEKFACKTSVHNALADAVAAAVGYGAVAVIIGSVRELMTYGTVFAPADAVPLSPRFSMPFVALVLLGFLAAAHKWLLIRFYPDEVRDTFSMDRVHEKPAVKDPGLFGEGKKAAEHKKYENIRPRHTDDDGKGGNV